MTEAHGTTGRMRDPRDDLSRYTRDVLIVCPACRALAHVTVADPSLVWATSTWSQRAFAPRRLTCGACGHSASKTPVETHWGVDRDPFFGEQLHLRAAWRAHTLWAYDVEHLTILRDWIAAPQRERGPVPATGRDRWATRTMLESLPAWMTAAKHRRSVLAALDKLARQSGSSR